MLFQLFSHCLQFPPSTSENFRATFAKAFRNYIEGKWNEAKVSYDVSLKNCIVVTICTASIRSNLFTLKYGWMCCMCKQIVASRTMYRRRTGRCAFKKNDELYWKVSVFVFVLSSLWPPVNRHSLAKCPLTCSFLAEISNILINSFAAINSKHRPIGKAFGRCDEISFISTVIATYLCAERLCLCMNAYWIESMSINLTADWQLRFSSGIWQLVWRVSRIQLWSGIVTSGQASIVSLSSCAPSEIFIPCALAVSIGNASMYWYYRLWTSTTFDLWWDLACVQGRRNTRKG